MLSASEMQSSAFSFVSPTHTKQTLHYGEADAHLALELLSLYLF